MNSIQSLRSPGTGERPQRRTTSVEAISDHVQVDHEGHENQDEGQNNRYACPFHVRAEDKGNRTYHHHSPAPDSPLGARLGGGGEDHRNEDDCEPREDEEYSQGYEVEHEGRKPSQR